MSSVTRRIAGQFAWASSSRVIAALLQALLAILAARSVLPAEFGLLAAMLGITTVLQTVFDMGIQTFTTRERASHGDVGSVSAAIKFNGRTSLLLLTVSAVMILVAAQFNQAFFLMLPLAIWVSAERTADVRLAVAFADGDVKVTALNLVARRVAAILLFILLLSINVEALLGYSIAVAGAAAASATFARSYVQRRVTAQPTLTNRALLRASWPYWLNSVATQARNLDSTITAAVAGAAQGGLFSVASRLTSPLRILPTTLSSVLLPNAARAGNSRTQLITLLKLASAALLGTSLIYLSIFLASPWAIPKLLGADYERSVDAIQVVVAGLPFAALISLLSSILQARGRKHFVAVTASASIAICLLLVAGGSAIWGATGAAFALSITYIAQSIVVSIGFYRLVWKVSTC